MYWPSMRVWCFFSSSFVSGVKYVTWWPPLCVSLLSGQSRETGALLSSPGAWKRPSDVFSRGYPGFAAHRPGVLWSASRHGERTHASITIMLLILKLASRDIKGLIDWVNLWDCRFSIEIVFCVCVCVFAFMLLPVAGSSVGQSAVRSVSQHCAHDWDQPPADSYTTCALSGTRITCVF